MYGNTIPCLQWGITWVYHIMLAGIIKAKRDSAGLSLNEWQTIVSYYQKLAPDTLLSPKKPVPLVNDWAGFTLKTPAPVKYSSFTTVAAVNPNNHKIYTSDAISNKLIEWDSNFKMREVTALPSTAVNAIFDKDAAGNNLGLFSCIGQLQSVDFPDGKVLQVNLDSKDNKTDQMLIADDLSRPVQTVEGILIEDGLTDLVILGQGHLKGGVYLFKQNPNHTYTQTNISDKPGAVQAVAGDFNNDGWPDLMILFGSGDEGLWLFLNDHKDGNTAKNLLP